MPSLHLSRTDLQHYKNLETFCVSLCFTHLCDDPSIPFIMHRADIPLESLVAITGQSCNALPLVLVFLGKLTTRGLPSEPSKSKIKRQVTCNVLGEIDIPYIPKYSWLKTAGKGHCST